MEAIAKAHGGQAHAANRASGGADVWLKLPGNAARARSAEQTKSDENLERDAQPRKARERKSLQAHD